MKKFKWLFAQLAQFKMMIRESRFRAIDWPVRVWRLVGLEAIEGR